MDPVISKLRQRMARLREREANRSGRRDMNRGQVVLAGVCLLLLWAGACLLLPDPFLLGTEPAGGPHDGLVDAFLLLSSMLATVLCLLIFRPSLAADSAHALLVSGLCVASLFMGRFMIAAEQIFLFPNLPRAGYLLPFAFTPMVATLLLSRSVAIAAGLWTALALTFMAGADIQLFVTGGIAVVVSTTMSHRARTRVRVLQAGLFAGVAALIGVLPGALADGATGDVMRVFPAAAAMVAGGFLSAVVALLLLPLFEHLFRVTSDVTLLEISDLSQPLLQRLSIEAPGTYHHSVLVANLAQAAAEEIGENPLLARAAAYCHDVGKLVKPEFFAENISAGASPHDGLPPSMSALLIMSHVKEGLTLAMMHRLPKEVRQVIGEHHGTGLLSYFHHKAQTALQEERGELAGSADLEAKVPEESFRYSGPKPSSRISAIIALADTVEATSRSLQKPTYSAVEQMIHQAMVAKILDGQLNQCPITLEELTRIEASFTFTLSSMLHTRMAYPENEDRHKQPSATVPS